MGVEHYPTANYTGPVHCELVTDGDASALTVLKVYQRGTTTEIAALGAKQRLYITDIVMTSEAGGDVTLVMDAAAAGGYIHYGHVAAEATIIRHYVTPICCPAGVIPKFAGAAAERNTCIMEGFLNNR